MEYHTCEKLKIQKLEIIRSSGPAYGAIATISMGDNEIHIQYCPCCGEKIVEWK